MSNDRKLTTSIQRSRMYCATGSGSVTSSIWQVDDQVRGCSYHFNLFRLPAETGRASHLFEPEDLASLLKVCRELAKTLAVAPAIDPLLQNQLDVVVARLDACLRTEA